MRPCPCPGLLETSLQKKFLAKWPCWCAYRRAEIQSPYAEVVRGKQGVSHVTLRLWVCHWPVLPQEHQQVPEIDGRVALGPLVAIQDFLKAPCDHEVAELDNLLQALLQKCDAP